jgi:hypothetical protein
MRQAALRSATTARRLLIDERLAHSATVTADLTS